MGSGYYIPADTLVGHRGGVLKNLREKDFFGGLVPESWMATKAISHPLWRDANAAPPGWSELFPERSRNAVLRGYSAFDVDDALQCGLELLERGPVRLKATEAKAGRGQTLVSNPLELHIALAALSSDEIARGGLVLEEHLTDVVTHSVGQINVAGLVASYVGTQGLTVDNAGSVVYGGTRLLMVRGGYEELAQLRLPHSLHDSVALARQYEEAALASYPDLLLSRRNYDVAHGLDAAGRPVAGVLEQSWRIGGASSAEIFGLAELCQNPELRRVQAASIELYGLHARAPADARTLYQADDSEVGYIHKCVRVSCDECAD